MGDRLSASVAKFHALEQEYRLFEPRFEDFSAWRVMRNPVFYMLDSVTAVPPAIPRWRRVWVALWQTVRLLWLLLSAPQADLVVKTSVSSLRMKKSGRWHDLVFDPLLSRRPRYFKLLEINSRAFEQQRQLAAFPGQLEPSAFTFFGQILGRLFPADLGGFDRRVAKLFQSELGIAIDPAMLRMRVSTVKWQAQLYSLLLRRLRPKMVIVSDTGEYGLRLASLRLGISFAEVQHGVFDALHPDAIPDSASGDNAGLLIPDLYLAKGSYWIQVLAGFRHGGVAVPVGHAMIDELRARRTATSRPAGHNIVISSQGYCTDDLIAWIRSTTESVPDDIEWTIQVKCHPVYDNPDAFASLAGHPRISVIAGNAEPNVYEMLAVADAHLSISSACHFDAAALGVPSFVLPLPGHEILLDAVDGEAIRLLARPQDIWAAALSSVSAEKSAAFSEPDYVDTMLRIIEMRGK